MSDIDATKVSLPKNLPYPLTVLKVYVKEGDTIDKYSPIITYKYYDYEPIPISEQNEEQTDETERLTRKVENVGTYDSDISGKINAVNITVNDEIKDNKQTIFEIIEPCSHPIQYGGLCAVCGESIEEGEEDKRAPISMAHGTTDLKVSSKEAEKIEKSSTSRLLEERKLSLVVDLDQTVIHVTVDPTVAEWMSDPTNPNYDAVKDVKSFILEEPPILPIGYKGPPIPLTKRWYYVKLRPGLNEFLSKMNKRYEMHIYTMATRQYAESIAKIIDPDGVYFGERILSRDESGSLTQKSLQRLFPVDTSMVVVIDDRGDVWNWSPNLIKVVPYDFFLGIGDINSSFLPRQQLLLGPSKRRRSVNILEEKINKEELPTITEIDENAVEDDENSSETDSTKTNLDESENIPKDEAKENHDVAVSSSSSSPVDRLIALSDGGDNSDLLAVQESERTNALAQQETERPLAKLQENLDKIIEKEEEEETEDNTNIQTKETHNLLNDDDNELEFLGQALVRVHNEFYFEIEKITQDHENKLPDVKDIMIEMKSIVFEGCVFLLSGVLPLGTMLKNADIVIWAKSFGATFVENYTTNVTHVICKNAGTFKVRLAKSVNKNVKIVNPDWLFACMSLWDKVSEDAYVMKVDGLLSKAQVDDYMQFHGDAGFGTSIDWGDVDEELEEFIGSDEDDEDGSNSDTDRNNDKENSEESNKKHSLEHTSDADEYNAKKVKKDTNDDAEEEPEDDFERDLLEELADLE